jgi:D-beta-D-heptose 7-phosphate kinase/D-beta-D-heptose 1-phosphate adenosyltransferase
MTQRTHRLGGAANVAANIGALGGNCLAVGRVGNDPAGKKLSELFISMGLPTRGLVPTATQTVHKVRVMAQNQQLLRIDHEGADESSGDTTQNLLGRIESELANHRVLVLSDYGKGLITADLITRALALCKRADVRILVDPKLEHFDLYGGVDVITPNHHEAGLACGVKIRDEESLHEAGRRLLEKTGSEAVLITRGSGGMSLFQRGQKPIHIPTEAREVYDVSGAGDTVVATLALALASGQSVEEASRLANRAAGIVVGKLGIATLSPDELARSISERPLLNNS